MAPSGEKVFEVVLEDTLVGSNYCNTRACLVRKGLFDHEVTNETHFACKVP